MLNFVRAMAAMIVVAFSSSASADGVYPLYDTTGNFLGEVEVLGDVTDRRGVVFAQLHIPALRILLYVDPDAIYVQMTRNNPIIQQQTPFSGYWIGYDPDSHGEWSRCRFGSTPDHTGQHHQLYGDLVWTNIEIAPDGELIFDIDLGHCGDPVDFWATNEPYIDDYSGPSLSAVRDTCGNHPDVRQRALGCSQMIGHPDATLKDVTGGLWTRAYVRCGSAPDDEVLADLMAAVWLDPVEWQRHYQNIGFYGGPIDGRVSPDLVFGVQDYVANGCR